MLTLPLRVSGLGARAEEVTMADDKKPESTAAAEIQKRAGPGPAPQGQGKPASHLPKVPPRKDGK
jgi:hypothetical protein